MTGSHGKIFEKKMILRYIHCCKWDAALITAIFLKDLSHVENDLTKKIRKSMMHDLLIQRICLNAYTQ